MEIMRSILYGIVAGVILFALVSRAIISTGGDEVVYSWNEWALIDVRQ